MRKFLMGMLLCMLAVGGMSSVTVIGEAYEIERESEQPGTVQPYKRGGYRSPTRTYNPGATNPARTTPNRPDQATRNPAPARTTPAPRTGFGGFFGGLFGGLALGAILGSLFNPFAGFSMGAPFLSLLSFLLWGVVIYAVVRMFRRRREY
ncbi:hypothetical protein [Paenibacillus sp. GCM10012303]|uniref:hypothetical protein n=1 Tax=Paenibacillus sp. GCM10012303 TaxID=3317340 RepID=UPI00360FBCFD